MPAPLDFKQIAEDIDIEQVARHLNIAFIKSRAACPTCQSNSDRGLELIPETNTFRCWSATPPEGRKVLSGDCIAFYAHIENVGMYKAAKVLTELFAHASAARTETAPSTPPQNQRAETTAPPPTKPQRGFDPGAFAEKLEYGEEVAALEITQPHAKLYRVGLHRGKVYVPICPPDVQPACWAEFSNGKLRVPSKWLPDQGNVVTLRRA